MDESLHTAAVTYDDIRSRVEDLNEAAERAGFVVKGDPEFLK